MPTKPKNIILIVVDSLRYDSVHDKGIGLPYAQKHATQFSNARSAGCWTLPATTSMFTGLMPHEHGATAQTRNFKPDVPTLAEKLKKAGYNTYQATGNPVTTEIFGLNRGFDEVHKIWQHVPQKMKKIMNIVMMCGKPRFRKLLFSRDIVMNKLTEDMKVGICWSQSTCHDIFDYTRKKMKENEKKGESSFFFLNLMEAHFPYHINNTFEFSSTGLADKIKETQALYHTLNQTFLKKNKKDINQRIGTIIRERQIKSWELIRESLDNFIRELHEDKENLVIFCSDHGENFGDQGWTYHFSNVSEGGNRVPIFWLDHNGQTPTTHNFPVSARYLHHDILRACGIPTEGASLFSEDAKNLPIMQSYWYNSQSKTLDKFRFNQICFVENQMKYTLRDDFNRNFKWMKGSVGLGISEGEFEQLEKDVDPVEEMVNDSERKQFLRKTIKNFKEFSDSIPKN